MDKNVLRIKIDKPFWEQNKSDFTGHYKSFDKLFIKLYTLNKVPGINYNFVILEFPNNLTQTEMTKITYVNGIDIVQLSSINYYTGNFLVSFSEKYLNLI